MGIKDCPECGGKAVAIHMYDRYDRADYGWECGCARAKMGDGIHKDMKKVRVEYLGSKEAAIEAWNRMVENAS